MATNDYNAKIGFGERFRAYIRGHIPSVSRGVDSYLSLNLPDLVETHNLALRKDVRDIDGMLGGYEGRVNNLDEWKNSSGERMMKIKHRLDLLEKKYGVRKG